MATLAAMLKARGHDIQGSDLGVYPPMSDFLAREGIPAFEGYKAEQITPDIDLVVVGNAISRGNPELEEVLDRKVRFTSLPEAIRDEFLWQSRSIVIAGTHGKTTTTALTGWLLTACGRDPERARRWHQRELRRQLSAGLGPRLRHRGRRVRQRVLRQDREVPQVPAGHCRGRESRVRPCGHLRGHGGAAHGVPPLRRPGAAPRPADPRRRQRRGRCGWRRWPVRPSKRSALAEGADWRASGVRPDGDTHQVRSDRTEASAWAVSACRWSASTTCATRWRPWPRATPPVSTIEDMIRALAQFRGVRRRLELRGAVRGVSVFDDFAHHPTAILETLRAVRWSYPDRRVWAVFEPRSATSCRRIFQDDFARAFEESERRRGDSRFGLPVVAAGRRATVGGRDRSASSRSGSPRPPHSDGGRDRGDRRRGSARGGSRCHHVQWRVRRHSRQAAGGACPHQILTMDERLFGDRIQSCVGSAGVVERAPLGPLTTFGVGGPADWLVDDPQPVRTVRGSRRVP